LNKSNTEGKTKDWSADTRRPLSSTMVAGIGQAPLEIADIMDIPEGWEHAK
jgi:hypothetical protein